MRGRKPYNIERLRANGTYQAAYHANRAAAPHVDGLPDAPADFDDQHRRRWYEVCQLIKDMGCLQTPDVESIRRYVEMDVICTRAHKAYLEKPEHKNFIVYRDALQHVTRMQENFGFNPRARMSIKVEKKPSFSPVLAAMAAAKKTS